MLLHPNHSSVGRAKITCHPSPPFLLSPPPPPLPPTPIYTHAMQRRPLYIDLTKLMLLRIWGFTFDKATWENSSHEIFSSSPVLPFFCPLRILAAVIVVISIPSPTKRMTFLATFVFRLAASNALRISALPNASQYSAAIYVRVRKE